MNREERAKQFMPFDALKGLSDALRMKEFEVERVCKGDLSEEKITEISKILQSLKKTNIVELSYFNDGHYKKHIGKVEVDIINQLLKSQKLIIKFSDIMDIKLLELND